MTGARSPSAQMQVVPRTAHGTLSKMMWKNNHVFYLTFDLGWKDRLVSIETGRNRPVFEITLLGPLSQIKWLEEKLISSA